MDAAARLAKEGFSFSLAIAGDGRSRSALERQIRAGGLEKYVHLLGFRDDVAHLLPETDLFVLPSLTEGLPNVVLEAFSARVPVVATAVGGVPEVVEEAVTGYLVPARAPRALADKIATCLRDAKKRKTMGDAGYASLQHHDAATQLAEIAAFFTTVAASRP